MRLIHEWKVRPPDRDAAETAGLGPWIWPLDPWPRYEVRLMTHIDEEKVTTTTTEQVDTPKAQPQSVNLNVNTGGKGAETVTVDQTPEEPTTTRTTTTHTEVHESD